MASYNSGCTKTFSIIGLICGLLWLTISAAQYYMPSVQSNAVAYTKCTQAQLGYRNNTYWYLNYKLANQPDYFRGQNVTDHIEFKKAKQTLDCISQESAYANVNNTNIVEVLYNGLFKGKKLNMSVRFQAELIGNDVAGSRGQAVGTISCYYNRTQPQRDTGYRCNVLAAPVLLTDVATAGLGMPKHDTGYQTGGYAFLVQQNATGDVYRLPNVNMALPSSVLASGTFQQYKTIDLSEDLLYHAYTGPTLLEKNHTITRIRTIQNGDTIHQCSGKAVVLNTILTQLVGGQVVKCMAWNGISLLTDHYGFAYGGSVQCKVNKSEPIAFPGSDEYFTNNAGMYVLIEDGTTRNESNHAAVINFSAINYTISKNIANLDVSISANGMYTKEQLINFTRTGELQSRYSTINQHNTYVQGSSTELTSLDGGTYYMFEHANVGETYSLYEDVRIGNFTVLVPDHTTSPCYLIPQKNRGNFLGQDDTGMGAILDIMVATGQTVVYGGTYDATLGQYATTLDNQLSSGSMTLVVTTAIASLSIAIAGLPRHTAETVLSEILLLSSVVGCLTAAYINCGLKLATLDSIQNAALYYNDVNLIPGTGASYYSGDVAYITEFTLSASEQNPGLKIAILVLTIVGVTAIGIAGCTRSGIVRRRMLHARNRLPSTNYKEGNIITTQAEDGGNE